MAHDHAGHGHVPAYAHPAVSFVVLGTLAHAAGPMSAYDILDKLRGEGLRAPLQVYRALEKLTERGLAHRLESLNAFVCCADAQCHKSGSIAFAICEKCGRVEEFAERAVEQKLTGWSKAAGFVPSRMTIELRGICRDCANSPA